LGRRASPRPEGRRSRRNGSLKLFVGIRL